MGMSGIHKYSLEEAGPHRTRVIQLERIRPLFLENYWRTNIVNMQNGWFSDLKYYLESR